VTQETKAAAARPDSEVPGRLSVVLRELARVPEAEPGSCHQVLGPGAIVGRYELVREAGRGGFGVVFEARDTALGRTVAFKAVKFTAPRRELREERLLREAEAAARLSHPNIVTLFDAGGGEQGPYLVQEFLRGHTLADQLARGRIAVGEALRIAAAVASGLAHAHKQGVVHRDLTPANVFLCDEGYVKILDFGMAHAFGQRRVDGGTPGYMAPEQRRGAPEDERTDVYALGVLLHHMLAGEPPFPRDADGAPSRPPALEVPGIPGLGELVARMLALDPVQRPRDGGAVLPELTAFATASEQAPTTGTIRARRRRRRVSLRVALVVASVAVLAGGSAAAVWRTRGSAARAHAALRAGVPSIAVLPFADLSPQQDRDYFSDGLSEEILTALARLDGLRVPARTSCFYFKGKNAKLADIGRELNVRAVLEGSVRMSGNRVRVTAQVVDVEDGQRLWGQTYDREVNDIFAVQYEIARSVAEALDVKLVGGKPSAIDGHATRNPAVYEQYLLGRQHYHRVSVPEFRLAVEAFEKAIAVEPGYAPAWAGLAFPLLYLAHEESTAAATTALRQRALAAAEKAVALSPDLPEALATRGALRAIVKYDWTGARADLERAVALGGNDADTRRRYGILLALLGQLGDGIAEVRKSIDIDPLGQAWGTLGTLYQVSGELELSAKAYRRFLEVSPESAPNMFGLARALLLASKPKEALAALERCPVEAYRLWATALAEHAMGNAAAARAALGTLEAKYGATSPVEIAEVHAALGDKDGAFTWLQRSVDAPDGIKLNPFLRILQDDPRYRALLRKINLPVD
jgi:TolB-like protein/Tfp pilus assembly protein PilF